MVPPEAVGGQIVAVLENVLMFKPLRAYVGDVYITEAAIVFVKYQEFQSTGKIGGAAAAAVGGLPAGIGIAMQEKNLASDAQNRAARNRKEDYGLALHERLSKRRDSMMIPRDIISALKFRDAHTLMIRSEANETEFTIPQISQAARQALDSYLSRNAVLNESDLREKHGLHLDVPSPRRLFQQIVGNQLSSSELERAISPIQSDESYAYAFVSVLGNAKSADAARVCQTLKTRPAGQFVRGLAERARAAKSELRSEKTNFMFVGVFVGVVGPAFIAFLSTPDSAVGGWVKASPAYITKVVACLVLCFLFGGWMFFDSYASFSKQSRQLTEIIHALQQ